jgi:hypothetical protein
MSRYPLYCLSHNLEFPNCDIAVRLPGIDIYCSSGLIAHTFGWCLQYWLSILE